MNDCSAFCCDYGRIQKFAGFFKKYFRKIVLYLFFENVTLPKVSIFEDFSSTPKQHKNQELEFDLENSDIYSFDWLKRT